MPAKRMDASHIVDGIWIGNERVSQDPKFFRDKNIKAVVNCTPDVPNKFQKNGVEYLRLSLGDSRDPDDLRLMQGYLDRAVAFVDRQRRRGRNVLVHCHQGIQRSSTVVSAYLMQHRGMTFPQVKRFVPHRRRVAFYADQGLYLTFEKPLSEYAKKVKK